MKKMLFSAIAMVAFTVSANAQKNDHFINVGNLNLHCLGGATAAVAELERLGIEDKPNPKTGVGLYLSTYRNTYNACILDSNSLMQNNTISK
nr:hypothetical protein [uncultured Flavobacterium sp.]